MKQGMSTDRDAPLTPAHTDAVVSVREQALMALRGILDEVYDRSSACWLRELR